MKATKWISLAAACALLASVFTVMPASAAANYFTHPNIGFEEGNTTGWNETNVTEWTVENTDEDAYTGEHSLKITANAETTRAETIICGSERTMEAGTEYVLTMYIKSMGASSSNGAGGVQLYAKNANNQFSPAVISTDGWEQMTLTFKPTAANIDNITIYIRLRDHTLGTYYLDDIALYKKADLDAEEAAERAARFVFVTEYEPTFPMDSGETWNPDTGGTTSFDADVKMQGAASLKTVYPAAETETQYDTNFSGTRPAVEAGKTYEASVWVYIPEEETNVTAVALQLGVPTETGWAYPAALVPVTGTNGQWKRISLEITPDGSANLRMVRLRLKTKGSGTATVYWDAFTFMEKGTFDPVLRILDANGMDVTAPESGAFTVKYDMQEANEGKILSAAIYTYEDGGKKHLVEVRLCTLTGDNTEFVLPFTGLDAPTDTDSLKVMLWNGIGNMGSMKQAAFAFR